MKIILSLFLIPLFAIASHDCQNTSIQEVLGALKENAADARCTQISKKFVRLDYTIDGEALALCFEFEQYDLNDGMDLPVGVDCALAK